MPRYVTDDWYWLVGNGPAGQVYHSARRAYVPTSDPQYLAFLVDGTLATVIDTEDNLRGVLNDAQVGFQNEPLPLIEVRRPILPHERCRLAIASFPLASATPAAVGWDTELDDPANIHLPGTPAVITLPFAGVYHVIAEVRFSASPVGLRAAQLRLAAADVGTARHAAPPEDESTFSVVAVVAAAASASLRLFMEQRSGGPLTCAARITLLRIA